MTPPLYRSLFGFGFSGVDSIRCEILNQHQTNIKPTSKNTVIPAWG